MHRCPFCNQMCDCDGEEAFFHWTEIDECSHLCLDEDEDEEDFLFPAGYGGSGE